MSEEKETLDDERMNEIELLKNEVKLWKSKYRSQVSKMGGYKTKIQKEVKEREDAVEWKEKAIERDKKFLEENNFEEIYDLKRKVEHCDYENRKQLEDDFKDIKNKIIDELSKELVRWTEENDIDNQRSQGYLIGINKAKKIIKENFVFELKTRPLSVQGMYEKNMFRLKENKR